MVIMHFAAVTGQQLCTLSKGVVIRSWFAIMPTEFIYVDQALNTLKKVEQYISAGIETTIDVAQDLVEHSVDNEAIKDGRIPKLESIMLEYAGMERELNQFTEQVNAVKQQISGLPRNAEWPDITEMLEAGLKEAREGNDNEQLEKHEKFIELRQKIWDQLHPDEPMASQPLGEDEDLAMTQTEVNLKCPYTGREMVNPMRNINCKHNYDEVAVKEMFKGRSSVKCPVTGCLHRNKPFTMKHLEENKELKKIIDMKNRQAKKRK